LAVLAPNPNPTVPPLIPNAVAFAAASACARKPPAFALSQQIKLIRKIKVSVFIIISESGPFTVLFESEFEDAFSHPLSSNPERIGR